MLGVVPNENVFSTKLKSSPTLSRLDSGYPSEIYVHTGLLKKIVETLLF